MWWFCLGKYLWHPCPILFIDLALLQYLFFIMLNVLSAEIWAHEKKKTTSRLLISNGYRWFPTRKIIEKKNIDGLKTFRAKSRVVKYSKTHHGNYKISPTRKPALLRRWCFLLFPFGGICDRWRVIWPNCLWLTIQVELILKYEWVHWELPA